MPFFLPTPDTLAAADSLPHADQFATLMHVYYSLVFRRNRTICGHGPPITSRYSTRTLAKHLARQAFCAALESDVALAGSPFLRGCHESGPISLKLDAKAHPVSTIYYRVGASSQLVADGVAPEGELMGLFPTIANAMDEPAVKAYVQANRSSIKSAHGRAFLNYFDGQPYDDPDYE